MKHIIFDFDSTLVSIEGIDELAANKGVGPEVAQLTSEAMSGLVPLEQVFKKRLDLIQPTQIDLEVLSRQYLNNITKGAADFITQLKKKNYSVFVVTGGFLSAVLPVCLHLGIEASHVFANTIFFKTDGSYAGFDSASPLTTQYGKAEMIKQIYRHYGYKKTIVIGDGMSDAYAKTNGERFICFSGVIERPQVAVRADAVIGEFDDALKVI